MEQSGEEETGVGRAPRQTRRLIVGIVALVAISATGWVAASRVQSPAEAAARTAPPKPSLIGVPAVRTVLTSDVVVRATTMYSTPQKLTLPSSSLKTGPGIVTTLPEKGASIREGDVLLSVSGRPVLVLNGVQPMYRDLAIGVSGTDVHQLEEALVRIGFDPGPIDGNYDAQTAAAVQRWYGASGRVAQGPTATQLQAERATAGDLFQAKGEAVAAQGASATARLALDHARANARTAQLTIDAINRGDALDAVRTRERAAADADVARRKSELRAATARESVAAAQVLNAKQAGTSTATEIADLEAALLSAQSTGAAARSELAASELTLARLGREPALALAATDLAAAQRDIARAESDLSFAGQRVALANARAAELAGGAHTISVQVPADEVLFLPSLPVRVDDLYVRVGEPVTGAVLTVTTDRLIVTAAVTAQDAKLIRAGAAAKISETSLAINTTGVVATIATTPGTHGVDPQRFYLEVTPTTSSAVLVGTSVVVTITVASTNGEVLAVPLAAISVRGDGISRVHKLSGDGGSQEVTVRPGLSAKGLVAVEPIDGVLTVEDLVVVGLDNATTKPAVAETTTTR